jgi:hypothetical protein
VSESFVNKRHFPPSVFGRPYRMECMRPGCPGVLRIEGLDIEETTDGIHWTRRKETGLQEGQLWGCPRCMAVHEFYREYVMNANPGVAVTLGTVRVLLGDQTRAKGEPKITEFLT